MPAIMKRSHESETRCRLRSLGPCCSVSHFLHIPSAGRAERPRGQRPAVSVKIDWQSCGSLKRSLGMAASAMFWGNYSLPTPAVIPKSCGLEAASQAYLQAGILGARKPAQTRQHVRENTLVDRVLIWYKYVRSSSSARWRLGILEEGKLAS